MYFVLLKHHQGTISCPVAMKHEVDSGNPTIGHLMFLIEGYKVCNNMVSMNTLPFFLTFSRSVWCFELFLSLSIGGLKLWNVFVACYWLP